MLDDSKRHSDRTDWFDYSRVRLSRRVVIPDSQGQSAFLRLLLGGNLNSLTSRVQQCERLSSW